MKSRLLISVCLFGGIFGACSGAGDADIMKFDASATGAVDAPAVDAPAGEAQPAAVTAPAVACDPTTPCADPLLSYCYATATGAAYCTSPGCTSAADCPTGWFCDLTLTPSVCRHPPTGEGTPCAAPADCAQFEASYCETMVSKSCLVSGCNPQLNNCDDAHLCCDFASFGLPSLCVDKVLTGGKCAN
jgi:hypothetical protein